MVIRKIHRFLYYDGKHISKIKEEYSKKYNTNTIITGQGRESSRNGRYGVNTVFFITPNEII
jgi:hypothetical protein